MPFADTQQARDSNIALEYAGRFWHAANTITGFSIAHLIITLLSIGTSEFLYASLEEARLAIVVAGFTLSLAVVLTILVQLCYRPEKALLEEGGAGPLVRKFSKHARTFRIAIILIGHLIGVAALLTPAATAPETPRVSGHKTHTTQARWIERGETERHLRYKDNSIDPQSRPAAPEAE